MKSTRVLVVLGSMLALSTAQAALISESNAQWQLADGSKVYSSHGQDEAACWRAYETKKLELAAVRVTTSQLYLGCQRKPLLKFGPAPATCALPKPLDATRTTTCPTGTVGTYGQTSPFTCVGSTWTASGVWSPTTAPAGVCVTPPPPPPIGWTHLANEHASFTLAEARSVRYGCATTGCTWIERSFAAGTHGCNTFTFGSDPAPGVVKVCEVNGEIVVENPPPPPPANSALLTWTPPTLSTTGEPLTNLTGYRIYHGREPYTIGAATAIRIPQASAWRVTDLAPGTWYFAVAAVTGTGTAEQQGPLTPTWQKVIP